MTNILVKMTKKQVILMRGLHEREICHPRQKKGKEMALENRLKEYRARLGINQADMGKLAGVSRKTLSLIERGDYSPSVNLALKLAKICQETVVDIFIYAEDEEENEFIFKDDTAHGSRRCCRRNCWFCYSV